MDKERCGMMQIAANKIDVMESSMTAADKVRRQLKSGPKPKTRTLPSLFEAVKRLCEAADRGRSLMRKYGLDPNDIHLALIYRPAPGMIGSTGLPAPEDIGSFVTKFEQMSNVDFLGILWWQTTPETRNKPDSAVPMWITEFADDRRAAIELLLYRNTMTALPTPQ
jgi:hypothetical protein